MHFSHVGLKDFLPFLLTVLVLRSLPMPGGRVSIRKMLEVRDKAGNVFCE